MKKQTPHISTKKFLGVALIISALLVQFIPVSEVFAAPGQITERSLTLQAGAEVGGSSVSGTTPGATDDTVNHVFKFKIPTGGTVGSIKFQYCTLAADVAPATCETPTGLQTNNAAGDVDSQSGANGFSINKGTNGSPYITRPAAAVAGGTEISVRLTHITNPTTVTNPPTTPNQTFFVRISTYASEDTTGIPIDAGTVAASTNDSIDLTGAMPESLIFCTGKTIGLTNSVPDCSKATNGAVDFNQLFSPTDTATATSQMAASTNAGAGYNITVNGPTLQSGTNTIAPMLNATTSQHGISQFGMNLKLNTTTTTPNPFGAEISVPSAGTTLRGQAIPGSGYDVAETFRFNTIAAPGGTAGNNNVANSGLKNADTVPVQELGGTDAQIYTVSYIVNVPGSQPAGSYTTTLTYICTPTF